MKFVAKKTGNYSDGWTHPFYWDGKKKMWTPNKEDATFYSDRLEFKDHKIANTFLMSRWIDFEYILPPEEHTLKLKENRI
jgi:hypothetical protein